MPFESEIRSLGIELRSYELGRHDARCPRCSDKRKKSKLKPLYVTIEPDKFYGGCNHCSWTFPEKGFRATQRGGRDNSPVSDGSNPDSKPSNPDAGVFHPYPPDLRKYRNLHGRAPKFYWRFRNINNEWKAGTGGLKTDTLLYRIDEVNHALRAGRAKFVLIVEGEKDVDTCWRLGFAATCNAHGASPSGKKPKWTKAHSAQLRGADLVVFNDNDDAGIAHAEAVCKASLGIAKSVRRLELKQHWLDVKPGQDISDWVAAGLDAAGLHTLLITAPLYNAPVTVTTVTTPSGPDWLAQCLMSDARVPRPLPVLHNACVGLTCDPFFAGKLSFNDMARKPLFANSEPRIIEDEEITVMQKKLQTLGLRSLSKDVAHQAIEHVARMRRFHPLRDYLDALEWDGVERIGEWLPTYLGTENTEYTRAIGRMFLISMVARVFDPGCKVDYMLILEGPQGIEKSKACQVLAGDEYFSDDLPEITQKKDCSVHLRGKWLIEVSELHAFSKAEASLLKMFVSRRRELYRPPYGRMEVDEPRQCVFIGTSNKDAYLRDETGGRRFWPTKCGTILVDALSTDRNALLAEAVYAYRHKAKWYPDREFERQHIAPEQDARFEADIWTETVESYLTDLLTDTTTLRTVAKGALNIEDKMMDPRTEKRIASVLQRLGWTPERASHNRRLWRKPA
jgi:hypothetical protein